MGWSSCYAAAAPRNLPTPWHCVQHTAAAAGTAQTVQDVLTSCRVLGGFPPPRDLLNLYPVCACRSGIQVGMRAEMERPWLCWVPLGWAGGTQHSQSSLTSNTHGMHRALGPALGRSSFHCQVFIQILLNFSGSPWLPLGTLWGGLAPAGCWVHQSCFICALCNWKGERK